MYGRYWLPHARFSIDCHDGSKQGGRMDRTQALLHNRATMPTQVICSVPKEAWSFFTPCVAADASEGSATAPRPPGHSWRRSAVCRLRDNIAERPRLPATWLAWAWSPPVGLRPWKCIKSCAHEAHPQSVACVSSHARFSQSTLTDRLVHRQPHSPVDANSSTSS